MPITALGGALFFAIHSFVVTVANDKKRILKLVQTVSRIFLKISDAGDTNDGTSRRICQGEHT